MNSQPISQRDQAILTARDWLKENPLFLDTETTGLNSHAQICEIAIVDADGQLVFHSLIKPTTLIPDDATRLHGISNETIRNAPGLAEVAPTLWQLLSDRLVIIYNADFDLRLIAQSQVAAHVPGRRTFLRPEHMCNFACAMEAYAALYGDWDDYHRSYRWQKLSNAIQQCGLAIGGNLHRAQADAEACRLIVKYMAEEATESEQEK